MADVKALLLNGAEEESYYGRTEGGREHGEVSVTTKSEFTKRLILLKQLRALFLKDLTLQSRAIGTNVCQLLTPIIFISFAGLMQIILNIILKEHSTPVPGTVSLPLPMDISRSLTCTVDSTFNHPEIITVDASVIGTDNLTITNCHDNFFNFFNDFAEVKNRTASLPQVQNYTLKTLARVQDLLFDFPMFYIGKEESVPLEIGELTYDGGRSGFIGGAVPQEWCYNFSTDFEIDHHWPLERNYTNYSNDDGPYISVPFFLPIHNLSTLNSRLDKVVKTYNDEAESASDYYDDYQRIYVVTPLSLTQYNTTLKHIQDATSEGMESEFEQVRPSGALFINAFNHTAGSSLTVDYTIVANDLALYYPNTGGNDDSQFAEALDVHERNTLINMMHNALFKNLTGLDANASVAIATYIMPLPAPSTNLTIDISILLGGVLYPYAASFLLPVYMAILVKDKSERHLIMMEQNGLSRWTYWAVQYMFNYMLYTVIAIIISVLSLAFQIRLFTQTNAAVLILSFFLWGHAQVAMGFLFSNFFTSPRAATIVGYLLVFASVAVALLLELLKIFPDDQTPFPVYMFYPPFVFYRIIFYLINACIGYSCYSAEILDPTQGLNLVSTAMLYLGLDTIVILLASVYLSFVLPGDYGVRRSPFFPLIAVYRCCQYGILKLTGQKPEPESDISQPQSPARSLTATSDDFIDDDVIAEHELLSRGFPPDAPVVVYQLRKEYPGSGGTPPHVAVDSVSFMVQRDECFGLLGPNGAGKTTFISVLTGLYEPSRGTARIAGYDITTEINSIHQHLGVCPQFDIHHADLTAEEHLLFYARLKGVRWRREREVVNRALRQVNLYDARKRKSKALSGGMRRRLSIAMAIIGQPDILILDEPTTGLDPASRRQVWEVLEKIKEGRSVILTTHAMEEADHLCTRIGIMNYGRLRCLGTQTRLKSKFGSGYQLQFHCEKGRSQEVREFVEAQLPRAVHTETYADLVSFKLERADLVVSQLFQKFNSPAVNVGILDWGIKMTTLEDVFLNIVRRNRGNPSSTDSSPLLCPTWIPCQYSVAKDNGN